LAIFRARNLFMSAVVLAAVAALISGCGRGMTETEAQQAVIRNCNHNINQFMLERLEKNRIVMLADAAHGESLYMQRVVSFLNSWLDTLEHSKGSVSGVPTKILLVLEADSVVVHRLKTFFTSGNVWDAIDVHYAAGSQFTWETLEYYGDLRAIWKRAEALNSKSGKSADIQLDILGSEQAFDIKSLSTQMRKDYFVCGRDEYSSSQIIARLDASPDTKALLFYGAAHLNREKAVKHADDVSGEGYYLGYYLAEHYGYDRVYSIYQMALSRSDNMYTVLSGPGSTYAVDYTVIRGAKSLTRLSTNVNGGLIIFFTESTPPIPVATVWSENVAKCFTANLDSLSAMNNDILIAEFQAALRYLHTFSIFPLERIDLRNSTIVQQEVSKWKSWSDTVKISAVEDIVNLIALKRLVDHMPNSKKPFTTWYESMIASAAGFDGYHDTTMSAQERADSYWEYVKTNRQRIVLNNLVALLWVGTAREIEAAMAALDKETGEHFATPKDWTIWWRRNYVALPRM
jgi:hypothetical protein